MSMFFAKVFLLFVCIVGVKLKSKEEWKSRSIYQLLTDRFSRTNGDTSGCDLSNYCGGTFKGITNNLDYIQNLGFDAIWISPVIQNTDGGYHGYWAKDLYKINEKFGTEADLKELVSECHKRDIWVMIDVVANHVGPIGTDYGQINPFNKAEHYHDYCIINQEDFLTNQWRVENCRLAGLADLKQENTYVRSELKKWVQWLISTFSLDGIRIDTIPEVPKDFWREFQESAGIFAIGEIFDGRMDYVSDYQNYIDATLNYPLYIELKNCFAYGNSFSKIESVLSQINIKFKDPSALGVFVSNHDNARFLYDNGDRKRILSAFGFAMMTTGIPIMYYGDEQYFAGGDDPKNREPLWGNMNQQSEGYLLVKKLNQFRKENKIWNLLQIQRYSDYQFYAFTRGDFFFAFTNTNDYVKRNITYHTYKNGDILCNIFWAGDCITVTNQSFDVVLINGEFKIFALKKSATSDILRYLK